MHFIFLVIVIVILLIVIGLSPREIITIVIDWFKDLWQWISNFLQGEPFSGIGDTIKEHQTLP